VPNRTPKLQKCVKTERQGSHKSLEQYQKIPILQKRIRKSVVVQQKIGRAMVSVKREPNMVCKINWKG